jgi:hypothetical protein
MPADTKAADSLAPGVKNRSTTPGDAPEALKRRYYTDERDGDGLGFYVDARIQTPAFRDRGRELVAARLDPNAIRDMTAIAQHRGWTIVTARGSADFRREAWLAGRAIGLEVRGHRATERDLQELQRRRERFERSHDRRKVRHERGEDRRDRAAGEREVQRERREETRAPSQMRIVEAVVRNRIADPRNQDRIIAAARERIADWLERGVRFDRVAAVDERANSAAERGRGRGRGRER